MKKRNVRPWAGTVAHQVKKLRTAAVSEQRTGWSPSCSISNPGPTGAFGEEAADGPSTGAPAVHMGNSNVIPQTGSNVSVAATWAVNHWKEDVTPRLCHSGC